MEHESEPQLAHDGEATALATPAPAQDHDGADRRPTVQADAELTAELETDLAAIEAELEALETPAP